MDSENREMTATNNWSGLAPVKDYGEYKHVLDQELRANAEGFVRIGYLLKVARDTNILYESGYKSVAEFAKAEYGLTKDIVSRYIAINDRYSENGYSDTLALQYAQYGATKLAEMLTLSDEVIGILDPSMTRKEIQNIKTEIKEEEKITDLEVMIEEKPEEIKELSFTQQVIVEYFRSEKQKWLDVRKAESGHAMDALSPSEFTFIWVRVPGTGKIAVTISMSSKTVKYVNVRTNETEEQSFENFMADIEVIYFGLPATEEAYNNYYHIISEEKPEEKTGPVLVPNYRDILPKETKAGASADWLSGYHEGDRVVWTNPTDDGKKAGTLIRKTGTLRTWHFKPVTGDEEIVVNEKDIAHMAREIDVEEKQAAEITKVVSVQPEEAEKNEAKAECEAEISEQTGLETEHESENDNQAAEPKPDVIETQENVIETQENVIETQENVIKMSEDVTDEFESDTDSEKKRLMERICGLIEGFNEIDTWHDMSDSMLKAIRDRAEYLISEIDEYRRMK